MAADQPASIDSLLNGPVPAPSPSPEQAPTAPRPPTGVPPPPARWQTPVPPSSAGTGSVTYTESALNRFAQTSDGRAAGFERALAQAEDIQVSRDAFGYMFGALVYSAYHKHIQSVTDGIRSAATVMSGIATAMRGTAGSVRAENHAISSDLGQISGGR